MRLPAVAVFLLALPVFAQAPPSSVARPSNAVPEELRAVSFEQRLGEQLPLDVRLRTSTGVDKSLGEILRRHRSQGSQDDRPALLVPVYYDCPMLCGLTLEGLTKSLKTISLTPGHDFDVILFSIDPSEGFDRAAMTRQRVLGKMGGEVDPGGWHFLVAAQDAIDELTKAMGFGFARDETTGEYAHAAGLQVLTPDGRIARVFYGVEFPPRDLRLALVDAGNGAIGNVVDQILLYCFKYDPATGRYSAAILNIVRAAGLMTALLIGGFLFFSWRRERTRPRLDSPARRNV